MTTGHPTNSARRTILIQGLAAALCGAFIGGLRVAVASEAGDGGAVSIELFAPSGKRGGRGGGGGGGGGRGGEAATPAVAPPHRPRGPVGGPRGGGGGRGRAPPKTKNK